MIAAPFPHDEGSRLAALHELQLLDTAADPVLDGLVRSAAMTLGCPIALVSLIASDRQWFKSRVGLAAAQTGRDVAFCAHTILGEELFVVPDAAEDQRFHDNPLVTGDPHVRFYAGAPLSVDGHTIGTLCVIDHVPRQIGAAQRGLLIDLARAVEHWMVSWREHRQLRDTQAFMACIAEHVPGVFYQYRREADGTSRFPFASARIRDVYELTPDEVVHDAGAMAARLHPDDADGVRAAIDYSASGLSPWHQQYRVRLPIAGERWLEGRASPQRTDDGAVLWCGFIQDITEQRAAEQRLREDLASRRASEARSQVLSRVSHELRTPLNAVLGFTRLMQADAGLPERTQRHLDQVLGAGERLLGLVDDILGLTRIERNGAGLSSGQVEGLFHPLEHLGVETRQMPGNSLDLTIASRRAQSMPGRIEVHAREGSGSRFAVWFPLASGGGCQTSRSMPSALDPDCTCQPDAALPLVLCVEDNPVNAMLLKEVLEATKSCRVELAGDGAVALGLLVAQRPALLLSDIGLPHVDGLELVRAVRLRAELNDLRCIALSGDALPAAREQALQAGFDEYWTKPLDLSLIDSEMERLAGRSAPTRKQA